MAAAERHAQVLDADDRIDPAAVGAGYLVAEERQSLAVNGVGWITREHAIAVRSRIAVADKCKSHFFKSSAEWSPSEIYLVAAKTGNREFTVGPSGKFPPFVVQSRPARTILL